MGGNDMFGSTILDVAIGLIFTFLVVSLAAGSIIEAGASLTRWRSKMLLDGVTTLLNNQDIVTELYKNALVNPRSIVDKAGNVASGFFADRRNPAYIDSKQFAAALMDVVGLSSKIAETPAAGPRDVVALKNTIDVKFSRVQAINPPANPAGGQGNPPAPSVAPGVLAPNPQIQQLLHGIIDRSLGDPAAIKTDLAAWFDNGMDRISGVYKRWTQVLSLIIALIFAVGLDIDSIRIARELWAQPVLAERIKVSQQITDIPGALNQMDHTIPVGWPNGEIFTKSGDGTGQSTPMGLNDHLMAILGWLITALASLFGAPFWFDSLQSITRLKGAGPSPAEKTSGRAAAA
jgi:hypothetical protein